MDGETSVTATTTAAATSAPASAPTPTRTQAPPTSLYSAPADRQAVQVIQQAMQRPQSMAAQYLQQMYAAQQQHLLLQTAALQQQQSIAAVQQTTLSGSRQSPSSSPSPNGSAPLSPGASQASITLPSSPVTAQLISRSQNSSSTAAGGTISQQAMLLGNGSPTCSQAQMYLRTQMLILTPAATVGAVQSELPVISSASSQPSSTQVQSLAVRANPPGAPSGTQSVPLKASSQGPALVPSLPKMSVCPLRPSQQPESSEGSPGADSRAAEVTRLPSAHQLIVPTSYSPIQPQALVKHQLHCTPGHKGAHHQLIIQQPAAALRQVQPIALRVTAQETPPPSQHCVSIQTLTTPTAATVQSQHCVTISTAALPAESSQQQTVVVSPTAPQSPTCQSPAIVIQPQATLVQSQPPPLRLGPAQLSSHMEPLPQTAAMTTTTTSSASVQVSQHVFLPQATPSPPVAPPSAPPTSVQPLPLQALAVPSGQVLLSEEELPVAEALVQMPFQNLPPPQTIAVDLKVQPATPIEPPAQGHEVYEVEGTCTEETREEGPMQPRGNGTPTPPTLSPSTRPEGNCEDVSAHKDNSSAVSVFSCVTSTGSTSVIRSPGEPPYVNSSPPPLLPAVVRSTSQPPPASLPGGPEGQPPQAIVKPHILTHLIEGFVIQEGLEPFPVSRSSLMVDQQASLPETQEVKSNGGQQQPCDAPADAEPPENSTDSDMDDAPAAEADGAEEGSIGVLECEFCGKRGYAHTFLRSKRFCSMICVRRYNVSCTKRISLLKADKTGRWPRRTDGRRGRPPSRPDGGSREHFLRQVDAQPSREEEEEEEEPPVPMTTRLRRQTELERERERERGLVRTREASGAPPGSPSAAHSNPTLWSVQEVWSFIYSLPGCQDIAEEFRSQEIDGQALLLLTEEHLMSAMNIRLGPALKICARINSLKES